MISQKGSSPRATIKLFREPNPWDYVRFMAVCAWPILDTRLRYRNLWGTWSTVAAMDIFLLICAGHTRSQIASWLRVSRDTINIMTRKLTIVGVFLRRASRPETYHSVVSVEPSAQEIKEARRVEEITSNLKQLIEWYKAATTTPKRNWIHFEIDAQLSRLHQRRDLKYELRTSAQKYRPMTEELLQYLIEAKKYRVYGRKIGIEPNSSYDYYTTAIRAANRLI